MQPNLKVDKLIVAICLATLSGVVYANDAAGNLELPTAASFYTRNFQSLESQAFKLQSYNPMAYLLSANATDEPGVHTGIAPTPAAEFKPPLISGRKLHQYLGLGTVMLAGLTLISAPDQGSDQGSATQSSPRQTSGTTHTRLARATAAMAIATVMSGLVVHWNDIHWEDPFTDPDKMHARLGAAGALLMLYAVNKSAHSTVPTSHAGMAELGAVAMVVAIKLNW